MKNRLHFLFVTICLALLFQTGRNVFAQAPRTIEVGPHFGATAYVGELNVWRDLGQWDWKHHHQLDYDFGALARFNYNSRWSFRLDYTFLKINACDPVTAWRPQAKLNFRSTVHDLALMVEFNFLDYYTGRSGSEISPYIFGGVSGFMFNTHSLTGNAAVDAENLTQNPTDFYLDENNALQPAEKKNYNLSIPFGVGCKLSLTKHLATSLEWRMHYTFTDYLDDVSGLYGDGLVVNNYDYSDPTGNFTAGQQRGNSQTNDWFGMINLSLTWKFVIPNASACKMNIE